MAQPDLEDVIQQVMSIFESQFDAKLAAVDARKSDPLSPSSPVDWVFADIDYEPQYPAMIFTGHTTQETTDEDPTWRDQTYKLMIEAYYTAEDVQKCSRIIRRYGAAIDDTLRANQSVDGFWYGITNIGQAYWDTMTNASGGLFQAVRVTFDVKVITG